MKALLYTIAGTAGRLLLASGYAVISTYLPAANQQERLISILPTAEVPAVEQAGSVAIYVRPGAGQPPRRLASR